MAGERFDDVVVEWLAYQASPMGRLRTELFWRGIQPYLPNPVCNVLDILDIGGGSGELAEVMARAGHTVTLLDSAQPMLDEAQARMPTLRCVCAEAVTQHAAPLSDMTFDVITCHSVIEFVDDPPALLAQCRAWLRPHGLLSLAFGNQRNAVMQAAIVHKDLLRAQHDLHHLPQVINRLGKPLRLLEPDVVLGWLRTGFEVIAENGIRTMADLLDKVLIEDASNFDALLDLEMQMMAHASYKRIARFTQLIARKV